MPSRLITDYRAVVDTGGKKHAIFIRAQGISRAQRLKIDNLTEFQAVLTLLQGNKPVIAKFPPRTRYCILDTQA